MVTLNQIIQDTDNDIGRSQQALEITRPRKKKDVQNFARRKNFERGEYNPWEYLKAISHTIGRMNTNFKVLPSDFEESDEEDISTPTPREENKCVVCLESRNATRIF